MAKVALISPQEVRQYQTGWDLQYPVMGGKGWRVAQVVEQGQTFPMAEPIFWIECPDFVEQDMFVYNPDDQNFYPVALPIPVITETPAS